MSDLFEDAETASNEPEFTVTEISGAVKRTIEGEFGHIRVRGEVGRVSRPRSGHVYMDLKDDKSVLSGIMWKGVATRLTTQPEEGMEVVATGKLTTFGGQSKYQMVIEDMVPAGAGALMAMLEKRKKALEAEGLFSPDRKQPLPYLPEVIGVVTSPSGAVIRDILHRLRDRFPRKVLIWPVAVQGARCAPEVVNAINGFNALTPGGALPRPDLIIVARGGGSIEDLWGFNEEIVARAAAASNIPLISAVGHETDTTLIDYVSDMRAPTPTAAAELAVPVRMELMAWIENQGGRMTNAVTQTIGHRRQRARDIARALPNPETLLFVPRQRVDAIDLGRSLRVAIAEKKNMFVTASAPLRPELLRQRVGREQDRLAQTSKRLAPSLLRTVETKSDALAQRAKRLRIDPIQQAIARDQVSLAQLANRFDRAGTAQIKGWSDRLASLDRMHGTLGYKETLRRGYAVVRDGDDVVTNRKDAAKAKALQIEFGDGVYDVGAPAASAPKPAKKPKPAPDQGSLF